MNQPMPYNTAVDERVVDQTLAQWVLKRTGSLLLSLAVRAASTAEGQGHSCAWLVDPQTDAGFDAAALATLRGHAWVGNGKSFTPFVLDSRHRFYFWRNWQHEAKLAAAILRAVVRVHCLCLRKCWALTCRRFSPVIPAARTTGNAPPWLPCLVRDCLF